MLKRKMLTVLVCGVIALAVSAAAAAPLPQAGGGYAEPGPYSVQTVESLVLEDLQREADVLVRVYYPEGSGPFPLIVFSHSLRANKDIYGAISTHWASHGYVAVHPTHDDSGVGMTDGGMHPPADKVRNRLRDVIAVLDGLNQIESQIPMLEGELDADRLAVAGHSYGSFITMLSGGTTVTMGQETNVSLADPRIRCILPVSPSGRGDYGMSDASWRDLTMPALFFTGTRDQRAGRGEDWRMEPYEFSPAGDKYLVVIDGAAHGDFGGDAPSNAPTFVKAASVAFWDACLKGNSAGRAYLEGGFREFAGDEATIVSK